MSRVLVCPKCKNSNVSLFSLIESKPTYKPTVTLDTWKCRCGGRTTIEFDNTEPEKKKEIKRNGKRQKVGTKTTR